MVARTKSAGSTRKRNVSYKSPMNPEALLSRNVAAAFNERQRVKSAVNFAIRPLRAKTACRVQDAEFNRSGCGGFDSTSQNE